MTKRKRTLIIAMIIIVIVAVIILSLFNPEKHSFFPKCPFLLLTGYQCPGCGSQRAIHSLLHLDIYNALRYNLLLVISIPYIMLGLCMEYLGKKKKNILNCTKHFTAEKQ